MKRAHLLVALMGASFLVAGVVEPRLQPSGQLAIAVGHTIVIAVLAFAWCNADAAARGIRPPSASALIAGLIPPLGIPLYLFRTLPKVTALLMTLVGIGLFVFFFVLHSAGSYVSSHFDT
jgi:hypothetical protein